MSKRSIILVLIILLAFVLRFYRLGSYPALNADEAALGYNAYSLLETGKDEHGNTWPLHFQSFNDWKPGLLVYLSMPAVTIFGLNVFALRALPALLAVVSVYLVYLFAKQLYGKGSDRFALMAAFLLAVSPWHIHFSRGAWEVNVATFLLISGACLMYASVKKPKLLFAAAAMFVLSLYTYHSARLIAPLLALGIAAAKRRNFLFQKKTVVLASLFAVIALIPLLISMAGPAGVSRAAGVGLFADKGPVNRVNEQRGEHPDSGGMFARIFHNKLINYGLAMADNWASHYHGEFLFLSGDEIQRNKVPETGQALLITLPFLLVGVLYIISKPERSGLLLWWFVIAPIAAALTFQSPHALRAHNMVIPLTLVSALGADRLITWLNSRLRPRFFTVSCILLLTIFTWEVVRYVHMYHIHMAKEYPYSSQYGLKELVLYTKQVQEEYNNIIVTDRYDQPYILFLFYSEYPPQMFQIEHTLTERDEYGFSTVRSFGKYRFRALDSIENIIGDYPNALFAGTPDEIPPKLRTVEKIYFPSGEVAFNIIKN